MSVPGIDSPVSVEEEAFDFVVPEDTEPRQSKFNFEPGKYPGKVISVKKTTSGKGNPQLEFQVIGTGGKAAGIEYRVWLQLAGPGVYITEKVLKNAFGFMQNGRTFEGLKTSAFIGKAVTMVLKSDTYEGKTRLKCDTLYAAQAETPQDNSDLPPF